MNHVTTPKFLDQDKYISSHYSKLWQISEFDVAVIAQCYWRRLIQRTAKALTSCNIYPYSPGPVIGGSRWQLLDQLVTSPFSSPDIYLPTTREDMVNIDHGCPVGRFALSTCEAEVRNKVLSRHNTRIVWSKINTEKHCKTDVCFGTVTDLEAALVQAKVYIALHPETAQNAVAIQERFLLSIQHDKSVERERLRYKQYEDEYYGRA